MSKDIYQCKICQKEFKSSQSLNAHMNIHSDTKVIYKKKQCPTCEKNITNQFYMQHIEKRKFCLECSKIFCIPISQPNKKFCSQSCSAKFNNKKKIKNKLYWYCKNCGKEHNKSNKGKNNYCNNKCQGEFEWIEKIKEIKNGECSHPLTIKKYLKESYGNKCSECGISNEWNGKLLSLQLDHIDGNSDNNLLDNLRLLCPNCHSQTETYCRGYNKKTKRSAYIKKYKKKNL